MAATKSKTITVRIEPSVKENLKAMAEQERRSQANMGLLQKKWCRYH